MKIPIRKPSIQVEVPRYLAVVQEFVAIRIFGLILGVWFWMLSIPCLNAQGYFQASEEEVPPPFHASMGSLNTHPIPIPQVTVQPVASSEIVLNQAGYRIQVAALEGQKGAYRMMLVVPPSIREIEIIPCQGLSAAPKTAIASEPNKLLAQHPSPSSGVDNSPLPGGLAPVFENLSEPQPLVKQRYAMSTGEPQGPNSRTFFKNPFFAAPHGISISAVPDQEPSRPAATERLCAGYEVMANEALWRREEIQSLPASGADEKVEKARIQMRFSDFDSLSKGFF
jgi:hypothetical protein